MKRSKDWHPEDIKAAIRKRGTTLEDFSIVHGYSRAAVRMTLLRPSPNIQELIGRFLGVPPQTIWPSRYEADGTPRRNIRAQRSPRRVSRHCQKSVEA